MIRKATIIVIFAVLASVVIAPHTRAVAESELTQTIYPADCILTTVSTGSGPQVTAVCPVALPTINEIGTTGDGRQYAKGLVDHTRITSLWAVFNGVTYYANQPGSPLSLVGDVWVFLFDAITPPVSPGEYPFAITALAIDGQVLSTSTPVTILPAKITYPDPGFINTPDGRGGHGNGRIILDTPGTLALPQYGIGNETNDIGVRIWIDQGGGNYIVSWLWVILILCGLLTAIWAWRKKRTQSDDDADN